jgi:hypothetical protein
VTSQHLDCTGSWTDQCMVTRLGQGRLSPVKLFDILIDGRTLQVPNF